MSDNIIQYHSELKKEKKKPDKMFRKFRDFSTAYLLQSGGLIVEPKVAYVLVRGKNG